MVHYGTILFILPILMGNNIVNGQVLGNFKNIQEFLNAFCQPGVSGQGCESEGITDPNAAVATVRPISVIAPGGSSQDSKCSTNEKMCPQMPSKCVPNEIDCNIIHSGITCRIPDDYGVVTQVLICGDGTPPGVRCGSGSVLPFLTMLLVQCQSSNAVDQRPVSSLDVLAGPGDDGGAGVYRCSQQGSWEPQSQSPSLNQLTVSCRDTDCGHVPQPGIKMPIYRRWAWVRAIYKENELHCTATLVSRTAVVTAAHCLTRSIVGNVKDNDTRKYQLEIPGPINNNPRIKVHPVSIHIHPRYDYRNQQHDLAIMFFKMDQDYHLPTVCITDRPHTPTRGKKQVVASLQGSDNNGKPLWKFTEASWDHTCITHTTRVNSGCIDELKVEQSQFCATHEGVSIKHGSSGGPYLAEVGKELEEVWVLMGVLSKFSNTSSCMRSHSIYGQVADDSRWIRDCVFDKTCT